MVTLTIDGKEITVSDGTNLVEAAAVAGIEVPTYCYHPGLSVVGQCRICFVEVEGMPRLVTACSTPVQPEMVVFTAWSNELLQALIATQRGLHAPLSGHVAAQAQRRQEIEAMQVIGR